MSRKSIFTLDYRFKPLLIFAGVGVVMGLVAPIFPDRLLSVFMAVVFFVFSFLGLSMLVTALVDDDDWDNDLDDPEEAGF